MAVWFWAVGATMYTLLSGKFVHEAETINEQLIQTATQPAQPIGRLCPDLHEGVARIVDRALAYERNDRWPSASALRRSPVRPRRLASRSWALLLRR